MVLSLITLLPCFVSLLWIVSFSFEVKSRRQKVYVWSLVAAFFYYLAFSAMVQPKQDYHSLVYIDILFLPVGLALFSLLNIYVNMHLRSREWTLSYLLWLAPSLCIGVAGALMYGLVGFGKALQIVQMFDEQGFLSAPLDDTLCRTYMFVTRTLFNVFAVALGGLLAVQCVLLMRKEGYRLGDVARFFFASNHSTPGRVIAFLLMAEMLVLLPLVAVPHAPSLMEGIVQSLVLALIKHCQCHVVFFSDESRGVTLYALSHLQNRGQVETSVQKPAKARPIPDVLSSTASETESAGPDAAFDALTETESNEDVPQSKMQLLCGRLHELLEVEEVWRDDSLTISALAERLGVSRTTVSNMINTYYHQPVRDLINQYRIEAVKRYLLENPTATQEAVAANCGFKTASYLNTKFKEAVGTTPLLWLVEVRKK